MVQQANLSWTIWIRKSGKEFFEIQGETRNCIAILHEGQQTEILEKGPSVSEEEGQAFLAHFEALLPDVAVVAISGSLPAGLPVDLLCEISRAC